jgi:hypothetical protein
MFENVERNDIPIIRLKTALPIYCEREAIMAKGMIIIIII